jgi:hypothetical protein
MKIILIERGYEDMEWIILAQDCVPDGSSQFKEQECDNVLPVKDIPLRGMWIIGPDLWRHLHVVPAIFSFLFCSTEGQ